MTNMLDTEDRIDLNNWIREVKDPATKSILKILIEYIENEDREKRSKENERAGRGWFY